MNEYILMDCNCHLITKFTSEVNKKEVHYTHMLCQIDYYYIGSSSHCFHILKQATSKTEIT